MRLPAALALCLLGPVAAVPIHAAPGPAPPALDPDCSGKGDWVRCRKKLVAQMFGTEGELPSVRSPTWIERDWSEQMHGLPQPGDGTHWNSTATPADQKVVWKNNLTKLVWQLDPLPSVGGAPAVPMNATVWHTLNTSAVAPGNYPPLAPGMPSQRNPPAHFQKTLLLYHNGHETSTCSPNYDGVVDYFNQIGLDVMEFNMPLIGCNRRSPSSETSHQWFEQYETAGVHTIKYFIEPVVLAINYAQTLGEKFVMLGLSGGGWSTTLASAVDPRIQLSFPTAGSIPFDLKVGAYAGADRGDYEQLQQRPIYGICDYTCMYVLAALERERTQVQILHEWDPCCFRGQGRHAEIATYNTAVQATLAKAQGGWMQTAITAGDFHEVNYRDKVIVSSLTDLLRREGRLAKADLARIPMDLLRHQS